jgi:CheY-like chemotaxis protein
VFSDIIMPGKMDGLELARAIREKNPTLPIR